MPTNTSLAKSMIGLVAGICIGLTLLFGLFFDSFRMGIVIGLVAGGIISFTLVFLDIGREQSLTDARR
jgi:Kef-type K+ transport system membrane component KefB